MRKVLLVVDKPGWAFDTIARELAALNNRDFELEVFHLKKRHPEFIDASRKADLVFFMHWSLACVQKSSWWNSNPNQPFEKLRLKPLFKHLDYSRCLVGVHAHHDYDDRLSQPDQIIPPSKNLVGFLNRFKAVNTVSRRLSECLTGAGVTKVRLTENGVGADQFKPLHDWGAGEKLIVGCSGTKGRDWKEGITEFIEPLAELPFVELRLAIPQEGKFVPHERMPQFLNDCDVYVLASASEGFPLKVLEACACGRPVVTTKVGGCEDLIQDGVNGFFVERTVDAFVEKLELLHKNRNLLISLGRASRDIIEGNWTWKHKAPAWLDFIEANL